MRPQINLAFNVIGLAPTQQIGTLVAAATCWGLFFDEINKFFWWPLHLSGYLLIAVPLPLFIGLNLLRAAGRRHRRPRMGPRGARRHPDSCRHFAGPEPDRYLRQHLTQVQWRSTQLAGVRSCSIVLRTVRYLGADLVIIVAGCSG